MRITAVHRSGTAWFIALTLLAPLAALGVLAVAKAAESPLDSASAPEPLVAAVEGGERSHEVSVAVAIEYQDAVVPTAGTAGTVTTVRIAPGDEVSTGTVLASINNRKVTAYAAKQPLWRDLSRGAQGADVKVAQRVLRALGYYRGKVTGEVDGGTEDAIEKFNAKRGSRADRDGVLSLANVAWIGPEGVTVATVEIAVGDAVTSATPYFTTTAALASVAVTESPNVPRGAPVVLEVGEAVAPYELGSGRVTNPDFVAAAALALGPPAEGVGVIRLATPEAVGTVPASAVVSDASGAACIFPSADGPPVAVTPIGGSLGTVELDPALIGQAVLVNPREVRDDLACG